MYQGKKISVVMATYNGEKYIETQLQSIYDQQVRPDEVIICDDCSEDSTVRKILSFIRKHDLEENWSLHRNDKNLGWMRNFYEAVKKASGDIIFFSDQDDVWYGAKIRHMSEVMLEKKAGCVYAAARCIDGDGKPIAEKRRKNGCTGSAVQKLFDKSFNSVVTLGCRMCITREIADAYVELGIIQFGHDTQCGRLALVLSSLWVLDKEVMDYRIHGANTSGISPDGEEGQSTLEKRLNGIRMSTIWMKKLLSTGAVEDPNKRLILEETIRVQKKRYSYLTNRKGYHITELIGCLPYYSGIGMLAGDVAYKYGLNRVLGNLFYFIKTRFL